MYEQNTSMVAANEQNKFLLPAMVEGDFSRDEIAEDADGLQMMSFQRVKIPAGGALQFEVPTEDPDNPDYTRTLEGVILYNHSAYTLWPEGSEYDEDTKPLCSSVDGKTGIGVPGGACATCPMNAYKSARDGGRGKACKNMRHLYLLRSGEYMPLLLSLPPTSIRPFKEFLNRALSIASVPPMAVWSRSASRKITTAATITALQLSVFCVISTERNWLRSAPMPMSSRSRLRRSTFSGR